MYVFRLTATSTVGTHVGRNRLIPKGTVLQVVSSCTSHPTPQEISQAVKAQLGLDIPAGHCSAGNFKVERISK